MRACGERRALVPAVRATIVAERAEGEYGISCYPARESRVSRQEDAVDVEWTCSVHAGTMIGKFRKVVTEALPHDMPGGHADHH